MVRDHDRIILESCRFKGLQLCLDEEASSASYLGENGHQMGEDDDEHRHDGVVSVSDDAYYRSGIYLT